MTYENDEEFEEQELKAPWVPTFIIVGVIILGWILEWYCERRGWM